MNYINKIKHPETVNGTHYDLYNFLLGNKKKEMISNFESFDLLMYSVGATHGLSPHNRKFYWSSIKNSFEPIYYDGDISIFEAMSKVQPHFNNNSNLSRKLSSNDIKKIKFKFLNLDKGVLFRELEESGRS